MKRLFYKNTAFWGMDINTHLGVLSIGVEGVIDMDETLADEVLRDFPKDWFPHFPSPVAEGIAVNIGLNEVEVEVSNNSKKDALMSLNIDELKNLALQAGVNEATVSKLAKKKDNLITYLLSEVG